MKNKERSIFKQMLDAVNPYNWITWTRNRMFDYGMLESRKFPVATICIGNISVGGTGKTPHTEYLIEILHDSHKIAVLSRGYGRKSKGYIRADEATPMPQIGDEPFQIKNKYPDIDVAVCEKRVTGIEKLTSEVPGLDAILLDDAYQHRYVKAGLYILLIDSNRPIWQDNVLPFGRLRESLAGIRRADIVIMTKCGNIALRLALLLALGLVEAGDAVLLRTVGRLLDLLAKLFVALQLIDLDTGSVLGQNLLDTANREGREVREDILARREGHRAGQDVVLDPEPLAVDGLQRLTQTREGLACLGIDVVLVHHTALELRTLTGQLLGVEREILRAGSTRRDTREGGHPRSAAQLTTTGTQTTDAPCLLTGTNLLHLDADVETLGKDLDQLTEIDTLVGDVVEDGLDFVALILHVANLHIEPHIGGNLARKNHCLVLQGDGLLPTLDVVGLGLAVDLAELAVLGVEARAAHLFEDHVARERDDAYVVARSRLDGDDVATLKLQIIDVLVESSAGILEADLEDVALAVLGVALEPILLVELEAPLLGLGLERFAALDKAAATPHNGTATTFFGLIGCLIVIHVGWVYLASKLRKRI